jgi:hypothetical protein
MVALVVLLITGFVPGERPREATAQSSAFGPVNMAPAAGLSVITRTFDVPVADWNRDGYDDVLVVPHDPDALRTGTTHTSVPLFYKNTGTGTFQSVSSSFPGRDRHACSFADMNNDGRPDFFCTVGYNSSKNKELGIQQADGSFFDMAPYNGLHASGNGRHRTVGLFDANGDGFKDIYIARYYGANGWDGVVTPAEDPPKTNEFWLSHGGTFYTHESSFGLDQPLGAPKDAAACNQGADVDGDGDNDLMVCGFKKLALYENVNNATFNDVSADTPGMSGFAVDAELVDLNADGRLDLVRVKPTYVAVRFGNVNGWGSLTYGTEMVQGQGLATGDFDGDGLIDLYVVGTCPPNSPGVDKPDYLLLNKGAGSFQKKTIPSLPRNGGCGDAVSAMNYDADNRTDFIVVNGHKKRSGPIQLWSNKPTS